MTTHNRGGLLALGVLAALCADTALVLNAFNSNLMFFYTPSQVAAQQVPQGGPFVSAAW